MSKTAAARALGPDHADEHAEQQTAAAVDAARPPALEHLVAAHQGRIARLVHRLLDGSDEVEDVVQEVFVAALENLKRFRGQSTLSTWLITIAVNKCRRHRRRRMLRGRLLRWLAAGVAAETKQAESAEVHEEIRRAVGRLPTRYREPIVLCYFEGLSVAQIGRILHLATNTVEVRLSRARGKLRETLSVRLEK